MIVIHSNRLGLDSLKRLRVYIAINGFGIS